MKKRFYDLHYYFFTAAFILFATLKSSVTVILERDFASTLAIIGFASMVTYSLFEFEFGLCASGILLTIYLSLGIFYVLSIIINFGFSITMEASVNMGVILIAASWILLTLIHLLFDVI